MQYKAGPRGIDPERMPLVLMLHGSGERGDDNFAQLRNGVAELLGAEAAALHFACFFVVPQCSAKRSWVEVDMKSEHHVIPSKPSIPLSAVVELLDTLLASYPIDLPHRPVDGRFRRLGSPESMARTFRGSGADLRWC
jgi:predicted peptidase